MSKGRIMVVDDESILRMDLKEMLIEAGYEIVAEANSGDLAIELAAAHKPDLIIMDVKMPGMNGIKASRVINQSFHVPVLLLTAYSKTELVEKAREAGVVGYLVKPITERDLIPAVEIALAQEERMQALKKDLYRSEYKLQVQKKVNKAKGMLMEQYHWSEEEAHRRLRSYCMSNQMKMENAANQIIEGKKLDI